MTYYKNALTYKDIEETIKSMNYDFESINYIIAKKEKIRINNIIRSIKRNNMSYYDSIILSQISLNLDTYLKSTNKFIYNYGRF